MMRLISPCASLFSALLLFTSLSGGCAFLDPRIPCADDEECSGINTCQPNGFCTRVDAGAVGEDDAGNHRDGGAIDAGPSGRDGGDDDAGPADAGEVDGGPRDGGGRDGGNGDAGNPDAGREDAGVVLDAGADAGANLCDSVDGGIAFDPNNCGACGLTCASGTCIDDVCAPDEVGFVPGLATAFALDEARLHAYYARSEVQLYRLELETGEPPLLLENNVEVVDLEIEGAMIAATSKGPLGRELLSGTLPISAVGVLNRNRDGFAPFSDGAGNKFGLTIDGDVVIIGHDIGQVEFDIGQQVFRHIATTGRYYPQAFANTFVLALAETGALRIRNPSDGNAEDESVGSVVCEEGLPTITATAQAGLRHFFGASCSDEGAGVFAVQSNEDLTLDIPLTLATTDTSARVVDVETIGNGVYVGLQSGFGYSVAYVSAEGETRSVISEASGILVGLETTDDALYLAVTDFIADETRFYRIEALP